MKKLALIVAVIIIAVLAVRLWPDRTDAEAPAPAAATATPAATVPPNSVAPTTPAATAASQVSGPYGGTVEARRQWEPTVQGFALAYPDTDGLTR